MKILYNKLKKEKTMAQQKNVGKQQIKNQDNGKLNKSSEKMYACNIEGCNKSFPSLSYYKCHQAAHSGQKILECEFEGCGRKFAWPAHLKYHLMTHSGSRLHKCPIEDCNKSFYTPQRLQVHMRVHTGEKPFLCPEENCDKSFTTAGNLKNHMRVHTGEKPFECTISGCGKKFAEHSSLKKHSLVHSREKPFICNICGKSFSQSGSRNVHRKRNHGINVENGEENFQDVSEDENDKCQNGNHSSKTILADNVITVEMMQSSSEKYVCAEILDSLNESINVAEVLEESLIPNANVIVLTEPVDLGFFSQAHIKEEIVYESILLHTDMHVAKGSS